MFKSTKGVSLYFTLIGNPELFNLSVYIHQTVFRKFKFHIFLISENYFYIMYKNHNGAKCEEKLKVQVCDRIISYLILYFSVNFYLYYIYTYTIIQK